MTDVEGGFPRSAEFDEFVGRVRKRLVAGAAEYGDSSFERPVGEVAGEISEELLDVAGWAWVMWCRVEALRRHVGVVKAVEEARRTPLVDVGQDPDLRRWNSDSPLDAFFKAFK